MKKEKSPVLVILTMLFLSLFIILPPTFRKMFPIQQSKNLPTNELTILMCNNIFANESYRVVSKTKYMNNKTISNIITYSKLTSEQNDTTGSNAAISNTQESVAQNVVADELKYFRSIPNLNIVDSNNSIVVTINDDLINNNPDDERLRKYLNSIDAQQNFYKSLGYKCSVLKN